MATKTKQSGLKKPADKPKKVQSLSLLLKTARELGEKLVKQKKLKPL